MATQSAHGFFLHQQSEIRFDINPDVVADIAMLADIAIVAVSEGLDHPDRHGAPAWAK